MGTDDSSLMAVDYDVNELDAFADSLSHVRDLSEPSPFEAIQRYGAIVAKRAVEIGETANNEKDLDSYKESVLESRLWVLVHALYGLRMQQERPIQTVGAYSSDAVAQEMYSRKVKSFKEKWLLEGWLQDGMPVPEEPAEYRVSKWMYTRNQVKHSTPNLSFAPGGGGTKGFGFKGFDANKNQTAAAQEVKLVAMLDVDAPLREGKDIAPEDERADRIIFQYVFELLMNRKYEEAVEVAGNTGNWSLKLALRGWETYIDSEIDARYLEDVDAASRPHGVERKALWRRMCWELAHNARDSYERGVYGFLAGDLDSVLGLCHTWESQFLAYVNHIVNSEAEKPLLDSGRIDRYLADYKLAGADQISSVRKVLDALSRSSDPVVRAESQHPLRIIMGAIINDTVPMLVDSSAADIQAALEGDDDDNVALTSTLLRVLTHLVLFLNQIGVPTGQQKSLAIIVRAYILLLRDSDRSSRVPVYIAFLPMDIAKEVYSDLLAQVTDPAERRKHLQLGRKYHLDMDDIIRATVQQLFKEVAVRQAPPEGFLLVDTDISSDDIRLCRAVEWHIEAGLWYDAIEAIIGYFRHMLWRGRIGAALAFGKRVDISTVLKKYDASPSNLVSITDERRSEVLEYAKLVAVLKLIDQWSVVLPSLTGHPKKNISEAYQLVQTICDKVYEFSQTWLLDASGSEGDDALTKADCLVARSVYVPYLLLALVDILSEAGTINQGYLRQAVEVSVLVADERYRLYELFVKGGHLDELLRKVAVCATDAVATGEQGLWAL